MLMLPEEDGTLRPYTPTGKYTWATTGAPSVSREAYAAVHVVPDTRRGADLRSGAQVDWELTLRYRKHIWATGLGVAEAMDTAQRGSGLGWNAAKELIERTSRDARAEGGKVVCGVQTDQLGYDRRWELSDIAEAYREQVAFVQECGAVPVIMCSRHLARSARSMEDYRWVYDEVLRSVTGRCIVHWLGGMFDPSLSGYWGSSDLDVSTSTFREVVEAGGSKVYGVKISLLDIEREIYLRKILPPSVKVFTGDDLHYVDAIAGDAGGHSHALLGVFDAIAPAASAALRCLDSDDVVGFRHMLGRTLPLAEELFASPTGAYKTGLVFLAYINGFQPHFRMLGGEETSRSIVHLCRLFVLCDRAGLLVDCDRAVDRMRRVLAVSGVG